VRFLDANIFVRYLTRDDPVKARSCHALLEQVGRGDETATSAEAIIAEVVYVLVSPRLYGLGRQDIRDRLRPVLALRGLRFPSKSACLRALDLFAAHPYLDFEDSLAIAHIEQRGLEAIVSYDRDFDRIPGIVREEP
jgi:predicted nucleic acid-binding protein